MISRLRLRTRRCHRTQVWRDAPVSTVDSVGRIGLTVPPVWRWGCVVDDCYQFGEGRSHARVLAGAFAHAERHHPRLAKVRADVRAVIAKNKGER